MFIFTINRLAVTDILDIYDFVTIKFTIRLELFFCLQSCEYVCILIHKCLCKPLCIFVLYIVPF